MTSIQELRSQANNPRSILRSLMRRDPQEALEYILRELGESEADRIWEAAKDAKTRFNESSRIESPVESDICEECGVDHGRNGCEEIRELVGEVNDDQ